MPSKTKEFRDPVHDYVSVPADYCREFIDTAVFQRLRSIGHSSMRPLYPSAHHDRFVHSLGVFHLARIAFRHIEENTDPALLKDIDLDKYLGPFLIAALLHDCGHAPFSHTFEAYFDREQRARKYLFLLVDDRFRKDYQHLESNLKGAAPHEVFSAAVFLEHFAESFSKLHPDSDPVLVARMITGCTHVPSETTADQVADCLIRLINGPVIDIDKLDYVLRDTYSSGVNNVSVDMRRLLSALEIVNGPNKLEIAFRKSALSVVNGRNYLFRWIYSHHTVKYYEKLLYEAVDALGRLLSPAEEPRQFLDAVFSREVFQEHIPVGRLSVYLPCDYDLFCWLKAYLDRIPEVPELLARRPSRLPLWKTQAEFDRLFARNPGARSYVQSELNVRSRLRPLLGNDSLCDRVLVIPVKPGIKRIKEHDLFIKLFDEPVCYTELARSWQEAERDRDDVGFCYVYIPKESYDKASACIEKLSTVPV